MRIIFLDIDGVLNRTGYHPGQSVGLRSWIEPELAARLSTVIDATSAAVVLSSDWRVGRELDVLRGELAAAGVVGTLHGVTPVLGSPRWREIEAWLAQQKFAPRDYVIIDDGFDMGPLASRFVRTSPLNGLDGEAAAAILRLFAVERADVEPAVLPIDRTHRPRDVHAVNEDGMVACNPRDREAAHRAEVGDIVTTSDPDRVTCGKCLRLGGAPRRGR